MEAQYTTLLESLNNVYADIKSKDRRLSEQFEKVEDFITDDKESVKFIRTILNDDDFQIPEKDSDLYQVAQARARHSAITFLIGMVFLKHGGFDKMFSDGPASAMRLWMITALYHDYGYFLKDIKNEEGSLREKVEYYLLDDSIIDRRLSALSQFSTKHKNALAYTYEEIEAYNEYIRGWHKINNEADNPEKTDHGILGGIRIYQRLISRALEKKTNESELLSIKTSCLAIAQHNIFKSKDSESDKAYGDKLSKLYSTSDFVISDTTPLLLLLSLVDTFECVKKLSKGETKSTYFESKTVLSNISISVSPGELMVDYTKLEKASERNDNLKKRLDNCKSALSNIWRWTVFSVEEDKNGAIIVKRVKE